MVEVVNIRKSDVSAEICALAGDQAYYLNKVNPCIQTISSKCSIHVGKGIYGQTWEIAFLNSPYRTHHKTLYTSAVLVIDLVRLCVRGGQKSH